MVESVIKYVEEMKYVYIMMYLLVSLNTFMQWYLV